MRLRYAGQGLPQPSLRAPEDGCQSLERCDLNAFLSYPRDVLAFRMKVRIMFNLVDDRQHGRSVKMCFDIGSLVITHTELT